MKAKLPAGAIMILGGIVFLIIAFGSAPTNSNSLIAQMLPFTNSAPLDLKPVQLIYQQGGYWVYQIPSVAPASAPALPPAPAEGS